MIIPPLYKWGAIVAAVVLTGIYITGLKTQLNYTKSELRDAKSQLAAIDQAGKAQKEKNQQTKAAQELARKEAERETKEQMQLAADNAVANYRRRHPQRVCPATLPPGGVPAAAVRDERDDDAGGEPVAAGEEGFIQACGRDAGRLKVWQDWAIANQIPVR